FPMYDTEFQFAAPKRSNLASLDALAEKRVGVGPKGGTGGTYFPHIFKALDISAVIRNGAWEDILGQAASGQLDGLAIALGAPAPEVTALDAKEPLQFIQPSAEQIALLRTRFPELSPSLIPAGA